MSAVRWLDRSRCLPKSTVLLSVGVLGPAIAEPVTISWDGECQYTIQIDTEKHDERRVRNTIDLLYTSNGIYPDPGRASDAASIANYQKQCANEVSRRANLTLLPLPGLEQYRRFDVERLRDKCDYDVVVLRSDDNPSALRDYLPAAACSRYVDALEGKADLGEIWRETIKTACKSNLNPDQCEQRRLEEAAKPDGGSRMRHYVRTFGWQNCAVKYRKKSDRAAETEKSLVERFERAFRVKRQQCNWEQFETPDLN
jgi:hypothetical protein